MVFYKRTKMLRENSVGVKETSGTYKYLHAHNQLRVQVSNNRRIFVLLLTYLYNIMMSYSYYDRIIVSYMLYCSIVKNKPIYKLSLLLTVLHIIYMTYLGEVTETANIVRITYTYGIGCADIYARMMS